MVYCIVGYALSWVIHRIQSQIICIYENLYLYMEWLGVADRQYPVYLLDLRIPPHPPPPSLYWQPLPLIVRLVRKTCSMYPVNDFVY